MPNNNVHCTHTDTQNTYCQLFMDELRRPVNKFPLVALHAIRAWVSSVVPRKNIIIFNPQQSSLKQVNTFGQWKTIQCKIKNRSEIHKYHIAIWRYREHV